MIASILLNILLATSVVILFFKVRKLQHKNMESNRLIYMLFHDIGNPLMIIRSYTEILKSDIPLEKKQELLSKIGHACEMLKTIIAQVRLLKMVEEGRYQFKPEPVLINYVLDEIKPLTEHKLRSKGISLNLNCPDEPLYILAEKTTFIHHIFLNLINNAIKFSYENNVIDIQFRQFQSTIEISITDYGMGIPKEIVQHISKESLAASRQGTKGEKGSGYGLLLVKNLMVQFQGSMEIISKPHNGCTVLLVFPKAK